MRKMSSFLRLLDFPGVCGLQTRAKKAKSGNLNLFLRILPFFSLKIAGKTREKRAKLSRKRFRLPDFALKEAGKADFQEGRLDTPYSHLQQPSYRWFETLRDVVACCPAACPGNSRFKRARVGKITDHPSQKNTRKQSQMGSLS